MYKSIEIKNFRGIKQLEIKDFKRVNLFVGENDCGKTTVLEALFLLTGASNAKLPLKINAFRDLHIVNEKVLKTFFNKLDINSNIKIHGEQIKPDESRNLTIKPHIYSNIKNETTSVSKDDLSKPFTNSHLKSSIHINGLDLNYTLFNKRSNKKQKISTSIVFKKEGEFNIENPPMQYEEHLFGVFLNDRTLSFEKDMVSRLGNIIINKQKHRVIKILNKIEPSIKDLSLVNRVVFCDIGFTHLVPIQVVGNGLVKLLSIILAIYNTQNGIVLIDEIENGLYYKAQTILWKAIFESAKEFNVQIFATTHSIDCIKALNFSCSKLKREDKEEVRLYRIEKEKSRAEWYDQKILETSLNNDWEIR